MKKILFFLHFVTVISCNAQSKKVYEQEKKLIVATEDNCFNINQKQFGNCIVMLPDNWNGLVNPQSSSIDLIDDKMTMYAGYGIIGINNNMRIYDPLLYSNDHYIATKRLGDLILANIFMKKESFIYKSAPNTSIDGYEFREIESPSYKGVVLFRRFSGDGINTSYILSVRFAIARKAEWNRKGALICNIAANINCNSKLIVSDLPIVKFDDKRRGSKQNLNSEENNEYNPYLNTERIENPLTGEKRTVTIDMWNETGPQGPGYYFKNGNDIIKWKTPGY